MNIQVTVAGENRVALVKNLRAAADNLDGMPAGKSGKVAAADEDSDFDAGKAKKTKKAKPAAASFDEDDDDDTADGGEDDEVDSDDDAEETGDTEDDDVDADEDDDTDSDGDADEDEEPPKTTKAKKGKIDAKAVNEACKTHAKKHSFEKTKKLLQKKFGVVTVSKLKPEQYAEVIKVMTGK